MGGLGLAKDFFIPLKNKGGVVVLVISRPQFKTDFILSENNEILVTAT